MNNISLIELEKLKNEKINFHESKIVTPINIIPNYEIDNDEKEFKIDGYDNLSAERIYDILKKYIDSYLQKEDIINDEYQVSAYYIYTLLKEKFKLLEIQEAKLKEEINKDYNLINKFKRIICKNGSNIGKYCKIISYHANSQRIELTLYLTKQKNYFDVLHETTYQINKDKNSNELYFEEDRNPGNDFIERHFDTIMETFELLEYFLEIKGTSLVWGKQDFKKDIFNIELYYGNVIKFDIKVNSDIDKNKIYKRDFYNKPRIDKYIMENGEELLKKIPVQVDELNYTIKRIYEEEIEKGKVKALNLR